MIKSKKVCSIDNCDFPVYGKSLCFYHYRQQISKKSTLKRTPIKKISEKQILKNKEKATNTRKLHEWFLSLWDKVCDENGDVRCFETGKLLKREYYMKNSCCYSHCFPKSTHSQFAMESWNVLIVHPDVHAQWELDRNKTPKMLEYYNTIKEKYEINKLEI